MTVEERRQLLAASIALNPEDPRSKRYAMRVTQERGIEFFEAKWTQEVDGDQEFHGHPTSNVPGSVLRQFRDQGRLSMAHYRRFIKELG